MAPKQTQMAGPPATNEKVILLSKLPSMRISPGRYEQAHNAVVEKIARDLLDYRKAFLDERVLELMQMRLDQKKLGIGTYRACNLLSTPGQIDKITFGRVEIIPEFGAFQNISVEKVEMAPIPTLVPPFEHGIEALHVETLAEANGGPAWANDKPFFSVDKNGKISTRSAVMVAQMILSACEELVPLYVAAPVVAELRNPMTNKVRKVHALSWLLVTAEWDPELDMALLRLPDDSELEYVAFTVDQSETVVQNAISVAIGNALMSDKDRERIKNEGAGLTHLFRVYWQALAPAFGTFDGMVLGGAAATKNEMYTEGMEKVRS